MPRTSRDHDRDRIDRHRDRDRTRLLLLGCLPFGFACADAAPTLIVSPAPSARPFTPTVVASSAPAPSASPAAIASATAVASADPSAGPTRSPNADFSDGKELACANMICHPGTEACCLSPDLETGTCAPLVVPMTASSPQETFAEDQACHGYMPSFCDDSSDCPDGTRCCNVWYTSDRDITTCSTSCDHGEFCYSSGSCRTPGTVCIEGTCRSGDVHVRCGNAVCGRDKPTCCVHDGPTPTYECTANCASPDQLKCSGAADCAPGEVCQGYGLRSWCTSLVDSANASVLCRSDTECPDSFCTFAGGGRARCGPGKGVRTCTCE